MSNYIPENIQTLLSSFNLIGYHLEWNINVQNEEVNLTMKWKKTKEKSKSFSNRMRDEIRLQEFKQRKDNERQFVGSISVHSETGRSSSVSTFTKPPVLGKKHIGLNAVAGVANNSTQTDTKRSESIGLMAAPSSASVSLQTFPADQSPSVQNIINSETIAHPTIPFQKNPGQLLSGSEILCKVTEKVVRRRINSKTKIPQYLIKWQNRSTTENTWVNEGDLDDKALHLIDEMKDKIRGNLKAKTDSSSVGLLVDSPDSNPRHPLNISRVNGIYQYFDTILFTVEYKNGETGTGINRKDIPDDIFEIFFEEELRKAQLCS